MEEHYFAITASATALFLSLFFFLSLSPSLDSEKNTTTTQSTAGLGDYCRHEQDMLPHCPIWLLLLVLCFAVQGEKGARSNGDEGERKGRRESYNQAIGRPPSVLVLILILIVVVIIVLIIHPQGEEIPLQRKIAEAEF